VRGPHNIWRLIRTAGTFEKTGAMDVVLDQMRAPRELRIAARILGWPFKWLGYSGDPTLPPVLRAITALGPSYIKLGQILSTRPDFVGGDLALQLRVLQDKLPPFPTEIARDMIERDLEMPVDAMFTNLPGRSPPRPSRRCIRRGWWGMAGRLRSRSCGLASRAPSPEISTPSTWRRG